MHKISIVTISFNQARFLRRCIDSILNQNYEDFELIVVDPGSSDGSREIISSYGSRVTSVFEPDSGPADGLNRGFQRATGDLLGFVNADDFLLPGALTYAGHFFLGDPKVDVLYGGGYIADEEGIFQRRYFPSVFGKRFYVYGAINLFQQGFFFKKELFERAGGFNEKNSVCWDGELFLKFKLMGARFFGVPEALGVFSVYPGTITGSRSYQKRLDVERDRLFCEVMGRGPAAYDALLRKMMWLAKQVTILLIMTRARKLSKR